MVTVANNLIYTWPDPEDVFVSIAENFTQRAIQAVQSKGEFTVVFSGGNTPKLFFDKLASEKKYKAQTPWQKIKFFFADERYLPLNSSESNYHMVYEHLFSKVPILEQNIYRIPTTFQDPAQAARHYEHTLKQVFHTKDHEVPIFDLIYLGLGQDAHTASLMPFSEVVRNYTENNSSESSTAQEINAHHPYPLVTSLWVEKLGMYRITLTPAAINNAENIIFLVTGSDKASAVWNVLEGKKSPNQYPAQNIHCINNPNIWYMDTAAASLLQSTS